MKLKIMFITDLVSVSICVIISILSRQWFGALAWLLVGVYAVLWYVQRQEIDGWKERAHDNLDIAERVNSDNKKLLEEHRKTLAALIECGEIMNVLEKEDTTIRYIKAKCRMCAGCSNCLGCPLYEAGKKLGNVHTDGCQQMKWCELYAFLYPADALKMVLEWEAKQKNE